MAALLACVGRVAFRRRRYVLAPGGGVLAAICIAAALAPLSTSVTGTGKLVELKIIAGRQRLI
jgi:hypothetical protein